VETETGDVIPCSTNTYQAFLEGYMLSLKVGKTWEYIFDLLPRFLKFSEELKAGLLCCTRTKTTL